MGQHALDRQMGLAGVGRAENGDQTRARRRVVHGANVEDDRLRRKCLRITRICDCHDIVTPFGAPSEFKGVRGPCLSRPRLRTPPNPSPSWSWASPARARRPSHARWLEFLGADFIDGDDLHSDAARAKMSAGHPLDDDDRWPWLDRIAAALREKRGCAEGRSSPVRPSAAPIATVFGPGSGRRCASSI